MLHRGSLGRRRDDPQSTRVTFQPGVQHINPCVVNGGPSRAEQIAWARGGKANGRPGRVEGLGRGTPRSGTHRTAARQHHASRGPDITRFEVYESYLTRSTPTTEPSG